MLYARCPCVNVGALGKPTFGQFVYDDVAKWPNKNQEIREIAPKRVLFTAIKLPCKQAHKASDLVFSS